MRAKLLVIGLLLVTAAYCWGLAWIAWGFSRAGGAVGWGLAVSVTVLLVLSVGVIWREVLFGLASARLAARWQEDPPLVGDPSSARDGGEEPDPAAIRRTRQQAARAEFEEARRAVQESGQEDWRAWYRLAHAYDANRDRARGRQAARTAIRLERAERSTAR